MALGLEPADCVIGDRFGCEAPIQREWPKVVERVAASPLFRELLFELLDALVQLEPAEALDPEIAEAVKANDLVVTSIFVNPLQFGPTEDLSRYPRDLERDVALAGSAGADVVFAPDVDEMYPEPPATSVSVADLAFRLDGERRPGAE